MGIFIKKPIQLLLNEAAEEGSGSLRRVLGTWGLIAFGVGVIIGAGLFSITGMVSATYTGPAITIAFVIAAIGCGLEGLCYAEFASMIPISGSAYTYSYATMGELVAWIIGWDLVLEYAVASTTVAISWSQYFLVFLQGLGIHLGPEWTTNPFDGGIMNLPAAMVVVLMSLLLMRGTKESVWFNNVLVFLKLAVIFAFIVLGWQYINTEHYTPYIPENTGTMGEFGWSGILRGAAVAFFAFIGFDMVSTAAQETRNPQRNMPIGILGSLVICTILYVLFAHVLTGILHYTDYAGQDGIAPVALAISHMGEPNAFGGITPAYPWLNRAVILAILLGYCSVILLLLMGQSRIFMTMSRDGLLPKFFATVHPRTRTPLHNNLTFMVLIAVMAAFIPARVAGEMVSIGTLFAFLLVCAGVIVVRRTQPDVPRGFRVPWVPFIPILGILVCLVLMLFLPADTWIRLVIWMLLGLDIYSGYGMRHSAIEPQPSDSEAAPRHGQTVLRTLQFALAALCVITGFWHQQSVGWEADKTLFVVSIVFGLSHVAWITARLAKSWK